MPIDNQEIAQVFDNMAVFLEMKSDSFFKIRAYQRAARTIENLDFSLEEAVRDEMDLAEIPGFGEAISSKTVELVTTGRMDAYETLKAEFPAGVLRPHRDSRCRPEDGHCHRPRIGSVHSRRLGTGHTRRTHPSDSQDG